MSELVAPIVLLAYLIYAITCREYPREMDDVTAHPKSERMARGGR